VRLNVHPLSGLQRELLRLQRAHAHPHEAQCPMP
jgi:hypothetical protein